MMKYNRNSNYLGEMLIYGSFGMTTGNYVAYAILLSIWLFVFSVKIYKKELSNSKKEGWPAYKKQSHLFLW